ISRIRQQVVDCMTTDGDTRIAIEDEAGRLYYSALDQASLQLARTLIAHGVKPGVVVALPMPASRAYVIGMLATIRAGGIFMPVDPGFPSARLTAIFAQARPAVIVAPDRDTGETIASRCAEAPMVLTVETCEE